MTASDREELRLKAEAVHAASNSEVVDDVAKGVLSLLAELEGTENARDFYARRSERLEAERDKLREACQYWVNQWADGERYGLITERDRSHFGHGIELARRALETFTGENDG